MTSALALGVINNNYVTGLAGVSAILFNMITFFQFTVTYGVFTRWSKHEANLEHTSCMCIFNTFASCLLHRANNLLVCRCCASVNAISEKSLFLRDISAALCVGMIKCS